MSVHIGIVLDGRAVKKNNKYPVKLRVTLNRKTKYYPTVFDLSKEDYGKLNAKRVTAELDKVRASLHAIEIDAKNIALQMDPFTLAEFEREFVSQNRLLRYRTPKDQLEETTDKFNYSSYFKKFPILQEMGILSGTLSSGYLRYIKRLLPEGRISTAVSYHASYMSLKKFSLPERYAEITPSFLAQYEQWLLNQGLSKSTIGIYIRPLRCIFNEAIIDGIIKKEKCYPFGRRKYQIPTGRNIKKALSMTEVEKIYYYEVDTDNLSEQKARDFWLFCYFANGMNIKDVALLKNKDINGEFLMFERSKTERAMKPDPKVITVYINDDMKRIMERWGNSDKGPDSYIFTILSAGETPLRKYQLVQQFVSFVNKYMREIATRLDIDKRATTYVARHTFSTVLKRSGASTEYIQEALGHVDLRTTENYLDSFEMEVKKEFAGKLVAFKR